MAKKQKKQKKQMSSAKRKTTAVKKGGKRKKMTTTTIEKKGKELTPAQDELVGTATRAILRHLTAPVRGMVTQFVLHPRSADLVLHTKDTLGELKRLGAALVEAAPKTANDLPEEFTARTGGNKIGEEMWEKILARRREGATYEQLQEEFPVSETTLWKRFKDEGLVSGRGEKKEKKPAPEKDEKPKAEKPPKAPKKGKKKDEPAAAPEKEAKAEEIPVAPAAAAAKADW